MKNQLCMHRGIVCNVMDEDNHLAKIRFDNGETAVVFVDELTRTFDLNEGNEDEE